MTGSVPLGAGQPKVTPKVRVRARYFARPFAGPAWEKINNETLAGLFALRESESLK